MFFNKFKQILKHLKTKVKDLDISVEDVKFVVSYLEKYGYLDSAKSGKIEEVLEAVKAFQEFFALKKDGVPGPKTIRAMRMPRCCMKDTLPATYRWNKKNLTYFIHGYVGGLNKATQVAIINQAWESWEQHTDITVKRVADYNDADIIIAIGRGRQHNFDGPSGTLAWAELPSGNRKLLMRFDDDETWSADPMVRGILLLNVAAHEFGHLLGLVHSKVYGALMFPTYNPGVAEPQQNDDVKRIVGLYGAKLPDPVDPTDPKPQKKKIIIDIDVMGDIKINTLEIPKTRIYH